MTTRREWLFTALAIGLVAGGLGCGDGGPPVHPVTVTLQVDGGSAADLAGSTLDAAVDGDPQRRASGTIDADGTAVLETLHAGKIRRGVQEGDYRVRVVLPDDDKETRRKAAKAVAPRYLDFKTSGLSFKVPGESQVAIRVAPR